LALVNQIFFLQVEAIVRDSSVAGPDPGSETSVIKLPPGAGAGITNYGSESGSLLFYQKHTRDFILKKQYFGA
jgi:hypothetical protein